MNRRELCFALPAVSMLSDLTAQAQSQLGTPPHTQAALTQSEAFSLAQIAPRTMPNGGKSWNLVHGKLATGEAVAIHESLQPAGLPPNPPHQIAHSEVIFVREGTLEFTHNGKSQRIGPGGVIFVAPGTMHSARNVGDGPASYCVIAIGGNTK